MIDLFIKYQEYSALYQKGALPTKKIKIFMLLDAWCRRIIETGLVKYYRQRRYNSYGKS